jgi:hypothetical protein
MTNVVLVVLVVIAFVPVVAVAQEIRGEAIAPRVDEIQDQLGQYGPQTVEIGTKNPDGDSAASRPRARQQMKGLIAFNMLAASDCRLLANHSSLTYSYENGENQYAQEISTVFGGEDTAPSYTQSFDYNGESVISACLKIRVSKQSVMEALKRSSPI